jgi:hypothetical protein
MRSRGQLRREPVLHERLPPLSVKPPFNPLEAMAVLAKLVGGLRDRDRQAVGEVQVSGLWQ